MKKMLIATMALALVAVLMGVGVRAYFSDVESSTANTFTSGTLAIELEGGADNGDSVIGTWTTPLNWKPGESIEAALKFNNKGTVDAKHIWFMFSNLQHSGTANLMNAIIVSVKERFNSVTTADQAPTLEADLHSRGAANGDGKLTLAEFAGWMTGNYGYYTWDDQSGDGIVLAAGIQWDYDLILGFKFDENAGNEYQGCSCSFDLTCKATQNSPIEGQVCLH